MSMKMRILFLVIAAFCEVLGDAWVRKGMRYDTNFKVLLGMATLALYGYVVNKVDGEFSTLLGLYVCFFATAAIIGGWYWFDDRIPYSTILGIGIIIIGGLVIQYGDKFIKGYLF